MSVGRAVAVSATVAVMAALASCSGAAASPPRALPSPSVTPVIDLAQQPDANFSVARPSLLPSDLPAFGQPPGPVCVAGGVRATATMRQIPAGSSYGTAGLLTLRGTHCNLRVDGYVIRLLDASGRDLGLPVRGRPSGSPTAAPERPIVSSARLGFTWTGRYCGPRPAVVAVTVPGETFALRIPIPSSTPIPGCTGDDVSHLVLGTAATSGPVMPVPEDWQSLQARLVLPATVHQGPLPLVVVLSTSGTAAVSFAGICPNYAVTASIHTEYTPVHNSFGYQTAGIGDMCNRRIVIRPGKPVTVALGLVPTDTGGATWWPGSTVHIAWAIAGVPTATASVTVR